MDLPYSWGPLPYGCGYGHIFFWTNCTTGCTHPPRGATCQCGKFKADGKGGIILEEEENSKIKRNNEI